MIHSRPIFKRLPVRHSNAISTHNIKALNRSSSYHTISNPNTIDRINSPPNILQSKYSSYPNRFSQYMSPLRNALNDAILFSRGFGKFEKKVNTNSQSDGSSRSNANGKKDNKSSDNKKGGNNDPNPNQPPDWFLQLGLAASGAAALTLVFTWDAINSNEITWHEFQTQLLESGKVDRIVVSNRTTAKVYLREPVEIHSKQSNGNTFVDSGVVWKDPLFQSSTTSPPAASSSSDASTPEHHQRYPSTGLKQSSVKENYYFFSIGNVETFEQRLEDAQRSLNIQPRDFIPVMYTNETSIMTELYKVAPSIAVIAALMFMGNRMIGSVGGGSGGGMSNLFKMTKSPAKRITKENVTNTFADVAGCTEAKREIMEFVEFLKDSKKFTDLGAKIPRGALLTGPPGTGKTLLAKATAGEANVPFFSVSGSDFVEMFVGVGASRVRELFKEAKAEAPCIIFIDEIDAIGRKRGRGGFQGGNDERENTLNQLLVEMDGFDSNTNIVVIAGTNRLDVLDPALTRAGRFDRSIVVDKPDIAGRKGIFQVHLKNIVIDGPIDDFATRLAALTPGFVGADIANICNEAAIIAARQSKKKVDLSDFEAATDRVIGGMESRKVISPEEIKVIAYHEAGHAVAGWNLEHADPLLKVTIVPRGNGALGFAQYLPKEIFLRTRDQIMDVVCMALAGRASEQINFGKVTTGASDDLRRVTQIVYQMVQVYGMNERIGQVAFPRGEGGYEEKMYSNATAEMMDEEVRKIVDAAYERTLALIREKNEQVKLIAELLIEKETITNMDVAKLIGKRPFSAGAEYDAYANGGFREPKPAATEEPKKESDEDGEPIAVVV